MFAEEGEETLFKIKIRIFKVTKENCNFETKHAN